MSSAGPQGGGAAASTAPQRYFCHQCDRTISLTPSPAGDLTCPICHGGFVEEFDLPNPNPNPSPNLNPFFPFHSSDPIFPSSSSSLPYVFSTSGSLDLRNPSDLTSIFGTQSPTPFRSLSPGPEPFNPFIFLQNYFQSVMADGTNIQVVLDGGGGGVPLGGNLGDYFIGPGLEQLIQQLAENDPNRYGTPPAAKTAVQSLPDITIQQDLIGSGDESQCAVCKDAFEIGDEAKQMPCKHIYHKDCILPWLELHNSCPVCRYELPTDDPDYEQRTRGAQADQRTAGSGDTAGVGVAAAAGGGDSPGPRTVERRFRISLPWPLRAMGLQAETSSAEDGGNSGGSGGGRDGGAGGQGNLGSETRREDLD